MNTVSATTFEQQVLKADKPVIVDIWASWCGPCRAQTPLFEEAAKQAGDEAIFLKLDADDNQELVRQYKVMGIPTMLYFHHGALVDRKTGIQSTKKIIKRVAKLKGLTPEEAERKNIKGWFRNPFRR